MVLPPQIKVNCLLLGSGKSLLHKYLKLKTNLIISIVKHNINVLYLSAVKSLTVIGAQEWFHK